MWPSCQSSLCLVGRVYSVVLITTALSVFAAGTAPGPLTLPRFLDAAPPKLALRFTDPRDFSGVVQGTGLGSMILSRDLTNIVANIKYDRQGVVDPLTDEVRPVRLLKGIDG